MEFPMHPIFENCRRPTAALDRNLAYLGLVEILNGYPIDAVVLTTGCDKTTPAGDHGRLDGRHSGDHACPADRCSTAGTRASWSARAP